MTSVASFPLEGGFALSLVLPLIQKHSFATRKPVLRVKALNETMRLLLFSLSLFCLLAVISAKKQIQENIDPIEGETKVHSSKKYSKEYQKTHHHGGHKHKKHQVLDQPKEAEPEAKPAHANIPEPEIQLQSDIETSKKAIEEQRQKAEVEDLHLQDLTYEENLKKDKKKKGHHHAESVEKQHKEKDQKLFVDQEEKSPNGEKVIEDSFEPLQETRNDADRKNKGKDKKSKDKTKNKKKASEKNKDKSKKSKDGKKKHNKDKKNKNNKDKKKW